MFTIPFLSSKFHLEYSTLCQNVKEVNKICFCALFRLSNNTALGKKQYFVGSVFPR